VNKTIRKKTPIRTYSVWRKSWRHRVDIYRVCPWSGETEGRACSHHVSWSGDAHG